MKRWQVKLLVLAGVASLAAIPAASQQAPESLLPPGFGDPDDLPPKQDPAPGDRPDRPPPVVPGPGPATPGPAPVQGGDAGGLLIENVTEEDLAALGIELPKQPELPDWARRSIDVVGPLGVENWGLGGDAFGRANGAFLSMLMRRLDAPVPSRWTSILLRRALLSRLPAPSDASPVDWVAERAWLLLRMGEADAARMLVQAVDVDNFTPKMFQIAVQAALATADPAALCPLVEPGRKTSDEPVWPLAEAMCAALEGDAARASALIDHSRRYGSVQGIDLLLAEKIVGSGPNTRRAVTIQWDEVESINSWRFGLASATGLAIPQPLMSGAGARIRAWQARAPMVPLEDRLAAANSAASLGVFSSAAMVEIYSLIADATDPSEYRQSVGGRLREAYVAGDVDARMSALRSLWQDARTDEERHARLILTAGAAARIAPSEERSSDAVELISAMLTAGLDRHAARWSEVVDGMDGADGDRAWALLALSSRQPGVEISPGRISSFAGRDESERQTRSRLLFAALAGLDRVSASAQRSLAQELEVPLERRNMWTVMIDRAATRQQRGTVALLAAVGMQTASWEGVPPAHLYHIIRALRLVGLDYEARMIAAEALTRA
jgi:hypothetical protein